MTPVEKRHLLYILFLTFGLRLYVMVATPVIGTDGYYFVKNAQCFQEGQFGEGLRFPFHPFYPMLIAIFNMAIGNLEMAGKLVSLVFGTLTVVPLYFFTRSIFNHRVAIFAAFFLTLNVMHVRHSADIMTESTYIFFFVSGVWLSWEMLRSGSRVLSVLAGLSSALAYYTRPEGLGIWLIAVPWLFLIGFWERESSSRPLYTALMFTQVIVALVLPYVLLIHEETGRWHITKKGSAQQIIGYEVAPEPSEERTITVKLRKSDTERLFEWKEKGNYPLIGLYIVEKFIKVCYFPFVPFLLLGLFTVRQNSACSGGTLRCAFGYILNIRMALFSRSPAGEFFVISIFLLYFAVLFKLATSSYYVSGRYLLPLVALSAIWVGAGLERTAQYISNVNLKGFKMSFDRVTIILFIFIMAFTFPKAIKIKRQDEVMQKEAGYWLKHQKDKKSPVIIGLQKVAFYADGLYIPLPRGDYDALVKAARENAVDYLFVYSETIEPKVLRLLDNNKDFLFLKEWMEKKKVQHLRAYRFTGR